jgi:hypothetical protein
VTSWWHRRARRWRTCAAAPRWPSAASGLCGVPSALIAALLDSGVDELETVSNNCGVDQWGPRDAAGRQAHPRTTGSYVGREQGVRAAVPRRRARGRADAAGHARRAAARRGSRHPGLLHAGRRRHARSPRAGCRCATTARAACAWPASPRRPASSTGRRTSSSARSAPTSRSCTRATATATATSSTPARPPTSTRCARPPAGSRSPRSRSSSSPASSTRRRCTRPGSSCSGSCTCPDVDKRVEKRTVRTTPDAAPAGAGDETGA